MTTALARIADATGYDAEQVGLVKDTIAKGASDDELILFLRLAHRSGLDPFSKQIYLIPRWDARLKREVMTPQTGIDGLRLIADRTGNYAPGRAATFEYDEHGHLHSATAYIQKFARGIWHEVAAVAHYDEYVQTSKDGTPTQMWARKPRIMLAKCAEALALRRAFPADLSGLYTSDEVGEPLPAAPLANPATGEVIEVAAEVVEARPVEKAKVESGETRADKNAQTPEQARAAFFKRYARAIGGDTWEHVQNLLQTRSPEPTTLDGWREAWKEVARAEREALAQSPADLL